MNAPDDLQKAVLPLAPDSAAPLWLSPEMKAIRKTVQRIAPRPVPVLITGESGTGKEVLARLIHDLSGRKGPFVDVNCAALPRELIESELFGAVKGAYTGSSETRAGLFRKAEGGTLLLDEIMEMPIDTQSKLLRVLQEREVRPVGGSAVHSVNCRVIAASNRVPRIAVLEGRLRSDLLHRISTFEIDLPPLRERRMEIMPLADLFLRQFIAEYKMGPMTFSREIAQEFESYPWPGNIRELQSMVHRAVLLADGLVIYPAPLTFSNAEAESLLAKKEREQILDALIVHKGRRGRTAAELGINPRTLLRKMKKYKITI